MGNVGINSLNTKAHYLIVVRFNLWKTTQPAGASNTMENTPPNNPATLSELIWYVSHYSSTIYVREQNEQGKWGSYSLSELSQEKYAKHLALFIERFIEREIIPCRILNPDKE